MKRIAVVWFPGSNCEEESALVIKDSGMDADIIRWNDAGSLSDYDGYVLPGGWSYEDRIRAGVIAAQDKIVDVIKEQAAQGKPILGICNGCQILAETGIVPGLNQEVEVALAPNHNPFVSGYYCTWVYVKNAIQKKNAFNQTIDPEEVLAMPIAHGEGRFITKNEDLVGKLLANDQLMFRYTDPRGNIVSKFPINPNGAMINTAGITNKEGNVLALMPHPERSFYAHQVPGYNQAKGKGPGSKIFESMREFLK